MAEGYIENAALKGRRHISVFADRRKWLSYEGSHLQLCPHSQERIIRSGEL
jgi:hypothetical protein